MECTDNQFKIGKEIFVRILYENKKQTGTYKKRERENGLWKRMDSVDEEQDSG